MTALERRLYFMLPDESSATNMFVEMRRARVALEKIHFLGKQGTLPPELPEASVFQKTDIERGAKTGLLAGGAMGLLISAGVAFFPLEIFSFEPFYLLAGTVVGALIGMWIASMIGSSVPNSKLEVFQSELDQGKILMMVDVPNQQIAEISLAAQKHPLAELRGVESPVMRRKKAMQPA